MQDGITNSGNLVFNAADYVVPFRCHCLPSASFLNGQPLAPSQPCQKCFVGAPCLPAHHIQRSVVFQMHLAQSESQQSIASGTSDMLESASESDGAQLVSGGGSELTSPVTEAAPPPPPGAESGIGDADADNTSVAASSSQLTGADSTSHNNDTASPDGTCALGVCANVPQLLC